MKLRARASGPRLDPLGALSTVAANLAPCPLCGKPRAGLDGCPRGLGATSCRDLKPLQSGNRITFVRASLAPVQG